ncbi:immunoglobulin-like domain-containing protein [Schleiferilactobacillus perolens]|jgi:hypothetical protein|uniref:immunoglobulin-like domain-containing protein n=1 Tax=Schleiferilactobacillus perolens TaxID=100468 RepID=UPI002352B403|nr:SLAP domain-containing protein [Schleiferilactobacillus perolens]MCI2172461.1 SLAP domain-containing protein [Schleiferilactobacillus perolens]
MKKKQIRYMGAVAAALLAVAPITAPVLSQIVGPSVVQAADEPTGTATEGHDQALSDVTNYIAPAIVPGDSQRDPANKTAAYKDAYHYAYLNFSLGYQLATNDVLGGKAKDDSKAEGVAQRDEFNGQPVTAQDKSDAKAGYDAGYDKITEVTGQIKDAKDKLSTGTYTYATAGALSAAWKDADSTITSLSTAQQTLVDTVPLIQDKAAALATALTNLQPSTDPADQGMFDDGVKDGKADVQYSIEANKRLSFKANKMDDAITNKPQRYQDGYKQGFWQANGAADGELAAVLDGAAQPGQETNPYADDTTGVYSIAYRDAYMSKKGTLLGQEDGKQLNTFNSDSESKYGQSYRDAYTQATNGAIKGQLDGQSGSEYSEASDDYSYHVGYEYSYTEAQNGAAAGLKDAQTPKELVVPTNVSKQYANGYKVAFGGYNNGFVQSLADVNNNIDEETGKGKIDQYKYTQAGYHDGYTKAKNFLTELPTANDKVQSGKFTTATANRLKNAIDAVKQALNTPHLTNAYQFNGLYNEFTNALAGLKDQSTTPVTPPVTYPAPEFTYADGFQKDVTLNQGAAFDSKAGISAWTDSSKSTAIPAADWTVTGSVDTSKPGTYTLTYTIKNGYNQTASFTRTITVVAGSTTGVKFSDINKVIYVQASNADQYSYDANTGKFTKNDALASLSMASGWKTAQQAITVDGVTYYQVGANGWLNGVDITTARMVEEAGIVSVTNGAGAQTVDNAADGKAVKTLNNGSAWKYFASANGYYLVANDEWVKADDVQTVAVAAQGTFKAGHSGALLYDEAGNEAGRVLRANSSWKVSGLKYINGQAYYQVATHLYVKAADGAQIYTTGNQAVQLYNRDGNAIGSVLGARTSWKVSSVYAHQGHVYYQVATNQFVRVY